MPAHRLLWPQVTRDARFKATFRRTRVRVAARREVKCAQPADDASNGAIHVNQELVAVAAVHANLRAIKVTLETQVNTGQICTKIDPVFVPHTKPEEFAWLAETAPKGCLRLDSPAYTSAWGIPWLRRLRDLLQAQGKLPPGTVIERRPAGPGPTAVWPSA